MTPPDPLSALQADAARLHETFTALVDAGFTEPQAIALVAALLRGDGQLPA